jgi:hypothetical protein
MRDYLTLHLEEQERLSNITLRVEEQERLSNITLRGTGETI